MEEEVLMTLQAVHIISPSIDMRETQSADSAEMGSQAARKQSRRLYPRRTSGRGRVGRRGACSSTFSKRQKRQCQWNGLLCCFRGQRAVWLHGGDRSWTAVTAISCRCKLGTGLAWSNNRVGAPGNGRLSGECERELPWEWQWGAGEAGRGPVEITGRSGTFHLSLLTARCH